MKNSLFKITFILGLAAWPVSSALAQSTTLNTYHVSPRGNYQYIRLVPRTAIAPGLNQPCPADTQGTLYVDSASGDIIKCDGTWKLLGGGVWMQDAAQNSIILPSYTSNPQNIRVSIGTLLPEFRLTLDNDGGIFSQGVFGQGVSLSSGNTMKWAKFLWYPRKAAFWAGSYPTPFTNTDIGNYSVNLGYDMRTPNSQSTAFGACLVSSSGCVALGSLSTIGGGYNNQAAGATSTILGGNTSQIVTGSSAGGTGGFWGLRKYGRLGFVGANGCVKADKATVLNSINGCTEGFTSFMGGGTGNSISVNSEANTIGGGYANTMSVASYKFNFIAGGFTNTISNTSSSVILGGAKNTASGGNSFIGGGGPGASNPQASGTSSTILGGIASTASGNYSFIGGGQSNTASGSFAVVLSGSTNQATGTNAFVGGGAGNVASQTSSSVAGGQTNNATGVQAFIGGGLGNTANATSSAVIGGKGNSAQGQSSLAGGEDMTISAGQRYTFLWGRTPNPAPTPYGFILFPGMNGHVAIGTDNARYTDSPLRESTLAIRGTFLIDSPSGATNSLRIDNPPYNTDVDSYLNHSASSGRVFHQDLAEIFEASEKISAGDLLVIDPKKEMSVRRSRRPYDPAVIGVASASPAITIDDRLFEISPISFSKGSRPPVALAGRVILKVSLENGPIQPGDLLTSSSRPGYAMKATDQKKSRHAIVGKALEPFTGGPEGTKNGFIEVVIMTR